MITGLRVTMLLRADVMLNNITLLIWDGRYVLIGEEPSVAAILDVDPLIGDVGNLAENDYIDCVAYHLQYDSDLDDIEEELGIISQNLASMLNDDTVVIAARYEFRLLGIQDRKMGIAQHFQDIRRYYERNPFIA